MRKDPGCGMKFRKPDPAEAENQSVAAQTDGTEKPFMNLNFNILTAEGSNPEVQRISVGRIQLTAQI